MKNNLNKGAWKKMKNAWADALKEGKRVTVEIKPIFEGNSKRPVKFEVEYWINGEYEILRFNN